MSDSLGDRMKDYESVPRTRLVRRTPVMARLDGKAFHTLTRGLERPWDASFIRCMDAAAIALCENVQGARLAYVQSDEITLLLADYDTIKTEAWFDYEVQKMCSVSAAICTGAFMVAYLWEFPDRKERILSGAIDPPAFDARFWNLPSHEVANCFLWRQQDAVRNSIAMLGQSKFSHKQLHGKNTDQVQEMLFQEHGINWSDTPTHLKRGRCILRAPYEFKTINHLGEPVSAIRHRWVVANEIPTFSTPAGREFIEGFVVPQMDEDAPVRFVIENAFWGHFRANRIRPETVTIHRSPERVKLADVVDATGVPVPGLAECEGDGDGYGSLYVVDLQPEANLAHDHLYIVISESGQVEPLAHGFPPGGMYGSILIPVSSSE